MASQLSQTNTLLSLVGTQASPAFSSLLTPVSMTQPSVSADFSTMLKGMVAGAPIAGIVAENSVQSAAAGAQPAALVGMSLPLEGQMLPEPAIDAAMSKQILNIQDELDSTFADAQLLPEGELPKIINLPQVANALDQTLSQAPRQPVLPDNDGVVSAQSESMIPTSSNMTPNSVQDITPVPDRVSEALTNKVLDVPTVNQPVVSDQVKAEPVESKIQNQISESVMSVMPQDREGITALNPQAAAPVLNNETVVDSELPATELLKMDHAVDKSALDHAKNDHSKAEPAANQAVVQQPAIQPVSDKSLVSEPSGGLNQSASVVVNEAPARPDVVVPARAQEKSEALVSRRENIATEMSIPSRVPEDAVAQVAPEAIKGGDKDASVSLQRAADKTDKIAQVNLANGTPVDVEVAPEKADVKLARILESVSKQVASVGGDSEKNMVADTSVETTKSARADANSLGSIHQPSMARPTATVQLQMPPGMMPSHPQWGQAVSERVMWSANQKVQTASIQLDPPELGSLQVKLNISHDQVSVSFTSPHAHVRDALEQSLPRLREMMAEQGLNLGESSVNDQSSNQDQSRRERFAADGRGLMEESGVVQQESVQMSKLSLVDYYA